MGAVRWIQSRGRMDSRAKKCLKVTLETDMFRHQVAAAIHEHGGEDGLVWPLLGRHELECGRRNLDERGRIGVSAEDTRCLLEEHVASGRVLGSARSRPPFSCFPLLDAPPTEGANGSREVRTTHLLVNQNRSVLFDDIEKLLRIYLPHSSLCNLGTAPLPPFPQFVALDIFFPSSSLARGLLVPQLQQQRQFVFREIEGGEIQPRQVELGEIEVEDFVCALLSRVELGGGAGGWC